MKQSLLLLFILTFLLCADVYSQVAVNEFLADPENPLESEWIELINLTDSELRLSGWRICDLVGCAELDSVIVQASGYLVLCQDSVAFITDYPFFDGPLYEVSGWRQLNNSGDQIVLQSADGVRLDSVSYTVSNGGNISWERIDPTAPGHDPENWHQSLAENGSTPGYRNSVYGGFADCFSINLVEKLFSPGCQCQDNLLYLDTELPRECYLTLTLFSLDGCQLDVIYDHEMMISGRSSYDGRLPNGEYLSVGMYILLAEVEGECRGSQKLVFGVAKR
jgi:hypothetical protein